MAEIPEQPEPEGRTYQYDQASPSIWCLEEAGPDQFTAAEYRACIGYIVDKDGNREDAPPAIFESLHEQPAAVIGQSTVLQMVVKALEDGKKVFCRTADVEASFRTWLEATQRRSLAGRLQPWDSVPPDGLPGDWLPNIFHPDISLVPRSLLPVSRPGHGQRPDHQIIVKEREFCRTPETPKVISAGSMRAFFELCSIEKKDRDLFDVSRADGRLGLVYFQGTPKQRQARREKEQQHKEEEKRRRGQGALDLSGLSRRTADNDQQRQAGVLLTAPREPDAKLLRQSDEVLSDWLWEQIQPDLELLDAITWDVAVLALVEFFSATKGKDPNAGFDLWWDRYQEWRGVDDRNWGQDTRHDIFRRADIITGRRVLLVADDWLHAPHTDKKGRPRQYFPRHGPILSYRGDLVDKNSRRDRERMAFPDGLSVRIGPWAEALIQQSAYIGHYAQGLAQLDYKRHIARQLGGACFFLTHIFASGKDRPVTFGELMSAACIDDDPERPRRLYQQAEAGMDLLREKNLYDIAWAGKPPTDTELKKRGFWDALKPRPVRIDPMASGETLKRRERYIAQQKEKAQQAREARENAKAAKKKADANSGSRAI